MWQKNKTLIIGLAIYGLWAFISDNLITSLSTHFTPFYIDLIRTVNDLMVPAATFFMLFNESKKHHKQMSLSEKQYRALFDSNPNPMWIFELQTLNFIAVNDAAVVKYGFSREEFLKMSIMDIRPKSDQLQLLAMIKEDNGMHHEAGKWRHMRKSGETFPVSVITHRVFFNDMHCKMVMATDITMQVQHERQLQEAYLKEKELHEKLAANFKVLKKAEHENRLLGEVIDKINNMVVIVKESGEILRVNRAFVDFTGYTDEEAIGRNPVELLIGADTDKHTLGQLIETVGRKEFFYGELLNYKKNGEPYWTQISLTPIFDENEVFLFFISVETIITEQKEREQKILSQHAALQRIAWFNSHEIRRPVCSIIGLIPLLKQADSETEQNRCLEALEECSEQLDSIIKNINSEAEKLELDFTLSSTADLS
jgi:PAS domain S-box-containing protein